MARFRFRLATLLKLREATRDERQAALMEVLEIDERLQKGHEALRGELDELRGFCREEASSSKLNVDRLVEAQRYEVALRVRQAQIEQQRQVLAGEIERRRQALVEANREVRVLEKLRDHQAERHAEDESQQQMKLIDEVAQRRVEAEVCE